jgi:protein TonB
MAKPISLLLSILVTLGLIVAMYALIKMDEPELGEKKSFKLPKFTYVPKSEDVQTITPKPLKPEEVQEQPDIPDVKVIPDRVDVNSDLNLGAVRVGIQRDLKSFNSNDGEYLPIFRPSPIYPRRAAERGLCGYVDLSYTVTAAGGVRDPIVTDSSSSMFESAARKASLKYKYKPRQVGGKAVDVSGVEIRVSFNMEGGC